MKNQAATFTAEPRRNMGALKAPGRCVVCTSNGLDVVLDLGQQPLANGLLHSLTDPAPTLPLRLASCSGCGHVQLVDFASPEAMFSDYVFRTGASEPAKEHFGALACKLVAAKPPGWICEVGSNDGTLLKALSELGEKPVGVDPSSVAQGVEYTVRRYFGRETARDLLYRLGEAGAVVMCNVLAHAPDPYDLLEGAALLTAYEGLLVIEAPYLFDLLAAGAWDTIYHEHFSYYSAAVLHRMLASSGFIVERVERLPHVHGGSLRVWARRTLDVQRSPRCREWAELLRTEGSPDWDGFQGRVDAHAAALRDACGGKRFAAYGAAAKATVLLNYTGLQPSFIVDTTPDKWWRYIPGVGTPIVPVSSLGPYDPDKILVTAWNYAEHILAQHPEYAGRWIVPFGPHRTVEFH